MSSEQSSESDEMTEAEAIRIAQPRHTMKWLALIADVPIGTARHWLYVHISAARQREIARAALDEMDRQDRKERAAARRKLEQMAGIDGGNPMAAAVAGAGAGLAADRAGAPPVGARRRLARRLAEYAARD